MTQATFHIGVFGSAAYDEGEALLEVAQQIGKTIAQRGHRVVTGACDGLPFEAVKGAKSCHGFSVGFTAVQDPKDQERMMSTSPDHYDELVLIPQGYEHANNILVCRKYRNVASVARCDAAIFISGRWGTLNEFSIAFDMGKKMGVYTGGGKFSSKVKSLMDYFSKPSSAQIVYHEDPVSLVDSLISSLEGS